MRTLLGWVLVFIGLLYLYGLFYIAMGGKGSLYLSLAGLLYSMGRYTPEFTVLLLMMESPNEVVNRFGLWAR